MQLWHGVVSSGTGKRVRVDYGVNGTHWFPPNLEKYEVHNLIIRPVDKPYDVQDVAFAKYRCAIGDTLIHRFQRDDGVKRTWRGTVMAKTQYGVIVRYTGGNEKANTVYPERLLHFPAPTTAPIQTTAFWFQARNASLTKVDPSSTAALQRDVKASALHTSEKKKASKEPRLAMASLNCRTAKHTWRIAELDTYIRTKDIKIIALQETRWSNDTPTWIFKEHVVYSQASVKGRGGVAILVHKDIDVKQVVHHDALIELHIPWREGSLVVLSGHAPNRAIDTDIRTKWWNQLDTIVRRVNSTVTVHPIPIVILGDFNSELGKDKEEFMEDFCLTHDFLFMNQMFTKHEKNRTTFKGPNGRKAVLDACLIAKRWRSSITNVHATHPPIPSDHSILLVTLRFKISHRHDIPQTNAKTSKPKVQWSKLVTDKAL